MSRIELSSVNALSDEQYEQYKRFPANLTLALLRTRCAAPAYLSLGKAFPCGDINDRDREMIILRVGALCGSRYERMQHFPLARKAGWSEEDIANIEGGTLADTRARSILKFVDECVQNVKVSSKTFKEVRAYFTEVQVAELTLLIGHYMMTARFLETLEVPLDGAATSWDNI